MNSGRRVLFGNRASAPVTECGGRPKEGPRSGFFQWDLGYLGEMMLLDVGCGEGRSLVGQTGYCVGIDIAEAELRHAKEKLPGFGFVLGDAQHLPFRYVNRFFGKIGWSQYTHLHRFSSNDVYQLLKEVGWMVTDVQNLFWFGPVIDSIYFHLCRVLSRDPERVSQQYANARIEEINRSYIRRRVITGLDRILVKAFPSRCAVIKIMAKKSLMPFRD